ncbi:MAG: hypothetical protein DI533_06990 [Cereibacter sphaeroides]|uniref:Oxygen tolerance n=1 Tax=Cereibacter sphaeroides TaxID=1063 RepID=A0A2W5SLU7_CERSP|nr:MAG: hypothetical protein DI533_06990 [Cereibacter sphaeroides]
MRGRPILILFFLALPVWGQEAAAPAEQPQVQVELDPDGPVTVGTPVTVSITLLVPTYMPDPPVWPDLQLADAITRQISGSSRPVTQRIGSESWAGLHRIYQITPQRAAEYVLPPSQIDVTYADPMTNAAMKTPVDMPPIQFSAVVPKGAEGLNPFLAADDFTLAAKIDGPGDAPKPGAVVKLTLTQEAKGTEAMLLPPLLDGLEIPQGLRAYPGQPELTDKPGERGDPDVARRVEAVTYVVEVPGDYNLPAIKLDWWNNQTQSIATVSIDPVRFSVAAPPGWSASGQEPAWRTWLIITLTAGLGVVALMLFLLRRRGAVWRSTRRHFEPVLFRELRHDVHQGSIASIRPALHCWLDTWGQSEVPLDIDHLLIVLERRAYGPEVAAKGADADLRRRLSDSIARERTKLRRSCGYRPVSPRLPPLNAWKSGLSGR